MWRRDIKLPAYLYAPVTALMNGLYEENAGIGEIKEQEDNMPRRNGNHKIPHCALQKASKMEINILYP